jgi:DNA polymerase III alpha subunit
MSDPDALDALVLESYKDSKEKTDKWKKKSNPHLKDERALRHLDVRVVGILSGCTVKLGKPRPDGSPGQKWAILQIDDGTGSLDAFCFGKAWEKFNVNGCLESSVDQLVLVCGEVSRRVNYARDDRIEKKNPEVGDYNFTVREAYPLSEAMPLVSKGVRIALDLADADIKEKVAQLRDVIASNPGALTVFLDVRHPDGRIVEVSMGNDLRVACTVSFLSAAAKIVPLTAVSFRPDSRTTLAPREPRPWERDS